MDSEQEDTVFDQDLDADDDDDSSRTHDDDDDEEDDDDETRTGIVLADDEDEDDDDLLLDDNIHSTTTTTAAAAVVPTAVPSASAVTIASVPTAILSIKPSSPDSAKRHRTDAQFLATPIRTTPPPMSSAEKKPLAVFDDSRRLFQRLWTDEDEIELLRGFNEYTAQRGGATSHQDTTLFYDQIKSKLQLEFNKNQLVEKLRRLKKKYRNVMSKISSGKHVSFKSPHDQATFEISSKIWSNLYSTVANSNNNINASVDVNLDEDDGDGNGGTNSFNLNDGDVRFDDHLHKNTPKSRKRSHPHASVRIDDAVGNDIQNASNVHNNEVNNSNNNVRNGGNVSGMIEEVVRSCVGPVFKELLSQALATRSGAGVGHGGRGMMSGLFMNAMPLGFGGGLTMMGDEKWRKQQILELEVYSKRLALVQEQIRAQLEELRSVGR